MTNRWILLALGLGFYVGGRYAYFRAQTQRRHHARHAELSRWESEGGAVPITPRRTAQQVSPSEHAPSVGA